MMSTDIRLGENYADTLFELARESQIIDAVKEDLEVIAGIIEQESDLVRFLTSPYFSRQSKEQLVTRMLSGKIAELTMNFLMVLIRHSRIALLPRIIPRYGHRWDLERRCYPVKVTVSHPVEQDQAQELAAAIGTAISGQVRLELAVDPAILGGAVIRCGDKVIDNSVHNRLRSAVKTILNQVKGRK